jgi:type IV secretion system protein VirB5
MRKVIFTVRLLGAIGMLGLASAAHAQWAVIDVGAIAQLLNQIQIMEQELRTAQNDLAQAQQLYQSVTGTRGMQNLLSGTNRNYLPTNWTQVLSAMSGTGSYGSLNAGIQSSIAANSVLSPAAMQNFSPAERTLVQTQRQNTALLQNVSQQALATTSSRFASMQTLINSIGTARDPKAIQDLQARIIAEQATLQNDQTKLQALYQAAQAQELARRARAREQAISDGGSLRQLPALGL